MPDLESRFQALLDAIGTLLANRRAELGFAQQTVAKAVRVSQTVLSKLERGVSENLPGLDLVGRLEQELGFDGELRQLVITGRIIRSSRRDEVEFDELIAAAARLEDFR